MDFIEIAKKRYSVRCYLDKKVETEKLDKILQAQEPGGWKLVGRKSFRKIFRKMREPEGKMRK